MIYQQHQLPIFEIRNNFQWRQRIQMVAKFEVSLQWHALMYVAQRYFWLTKKGNLDSLLVHAPLLRLRYISACTWKRGNTVMVVQPFLGPCSGPPKCLRPPFKSRLWRYELNFSPGILLPVNCCARDLKDGSNDFLAFGMKFWHHKGSKLTRVRFEKKSSLADFCRETAKNWPKTPIYISLKNGP